MCFETVVFRVPIYHARHWPLLYTMDMLWEKFQWILPLYMKPINFQAKASVVFSVTTAVLIDFWLERLCFPNISVKKRTNEYVNSAEQITRNWNVNLVSVLITILRYYIMMQYQPIVEIVNGAHEWVHRPCQLQSASYHCCLYKHRRQDERQPPHSSWPVPICYLDIAKSGYHFHGHSGDMFLWPRRLLPRYLARIYVYLMP